MRIAIVSVVLFVLAFSAVHAELTKQDLEETRKIVKESEGRLSGRIGDLRAELKDDIATLRAELKDDITTLRAELKGDIASFGNSLSKRIDSLEASVRSLTGYLVGGVIAIIAAIIGQGFIIRRGEIRGKLTRGPIVKIPVSHQSWFGSAEVMGSA